MLTTTTRPPTIEVLVRLCAALTSRLVRGLIAATRTVHARATQALQVRVSALRACPQQGDVPGWVLVTVMTAGLVTVLWVAAGPVLSNLFTTALSSVHG